MIQNPSVLPDEGAAAMVGRERSVRSMNTSSAHF
jgi:hypothetical protein